MIGTIMSTFSALLSRADFRRLGAALIFSLLLHLTVAAVVLPALLSGASSDTPLLADAPVQVEIRKTKPTPRPAATRRPTPTPAQGSNTGKVRSAQANRNGSGAQAGQKRPDGPRTRLAKNDAAPGGGSPTPSKNFQGSRGVRGPVRPLEDILFTGGGRGGANLPVEAPRTGGGSGKTPVTSAVPTLTAKTEEAAAPLTAAAPPGAGTEAGNTGIGFEPREGIGTKPEGKTPVASLRTTDDGIGIGASSEPDAARTGTISPGGGQGDGASLPGTGGTGAGIGKGAGNGNGDGPGGSGSGGGGPGDGGRGALFGTAPQPSAGASIAAPLHIVYILDVSLSMKDYDKFAAAKTALKAALSELKPTDSFNIVPFCGTAQSMEAAMRPATPENIAAASTYVDDLEMGEGTNLEAGLRAAFAFSPVTQLYILSDGTPTMGETGHKQLRRLARELNSASAQVTTIGLGYGKKFEGVNLLKDLAREGKGAFQYIDLKPQKKR